MKTHLILLEPPSSAESGFPDADALVALRAWYGCLSVRGAVEHYLSGKGGRPAVCSGAFDGS